MRSRGLVVAIALVLAVVAAAAVILYTKQVKEDVKSTDTAIVIVSNQDINAGTSLDPLLGQNVFEAVTVPKDALVAQAVTSTRQLEGQVTTQPILAREQIPTSRLSSGESTLSSIGVSDGHVGVTMSLDGPQGGNGIVQVGDHVAVYVTFGANTPILQSTLKQLLTPQQFAQELVIASKDPSSLTSTDVQNAAVLRLPQSVTVTLIPSVKVLKIDNPALDPNGNSSGGTITLTLDLTPADGEMIVFANEEASIWLGLLPPKNANGYQIDATIGPRIDQVVGAHK